MNKLNLKISGINAKGVDIRIDDKHVDIIKNKFGNRVVQYETENQTVNIKIKKYLEINSRAWLFWQLLFFFVSFFGIFDIRPDKRCLVLDCEFEVKLEEITTMNISMNYAKSVEKALKVDSNAEINEIKNVAYVDEKAKKRMKILRFVKISVVLAIIVSIIIVVSQVV